VESADPGPSICNETIRGVFGCRPAVFDRDVVVKPVKVKLVFRTVIGFLFLKNTDNDAYDAGWNSSSPFIYAYCRFPFCQCRHKSLGRSLLDISAESDRPRFLLPDLTENEDRAVRQKPFASLLSRFPKLMQNL
jgi:hypothetical protein